MKNIKLSLILALSVVLLWPGAAFAGSPVSARPFGPDAPDALTAYTVTPNAAPVGANITFEVAFDSVVDTTSFAVCFYFKSSDAPAWGANFPANQTNSAAGVTYTKVETPAGACPPVSGYQNFYYHTTAGAENGALGDTLRFTTTVPPVVAESKITAIRLYSGTQCFDTDGPGGVTGPGGTDCNSDNLQKTTTFTVQASPTVIYASDQPACGGYGSPGVSCFQSLDAALASADTYGASTVMVVGDLTLAPGGSIVSASGEPGMIDGTSTPRLLASPACTGVLSVTNGATVRNLTIEGANCPSATGLSISADSLVNNITVQNFNTNGVGVAFVGTSGGTLTGSRLSNNTSGVVELSSRTTRIGSSPSNGNTFTNNGIGIQSNGGAIIKGNTISGGGYGVRLTANSLSFYGNRITGAAGYQVECSGASAGAAFNFLGGISPNSGSNCADVSQQLGSNYTNWVDGGSSLDQIYAVPPNSVIFNLGTVPPFNVGMSGVDGMGQLLSNFYAIRRGGNGQLTIDFSGTGSGRLYQIGDPGECNTPSTGACWDFVEAGMNMVSDPSADDTHYVVGQTNDPTAVSLHSFRATSSSGPLVNTLGPLLGLLVLAACAGWLAFVAQRQPARNWLHALPGRDRKGRGAYDKKV